MFLNAEPENWRMRADCLLNVAKGLERWDEFLGCRCNVLGDGIKYILKRGKRILKGVEGFGGEGKSI